MASRADETVVEQKRIEKRRKEKKRVENLAVAYQKLSVRLNRISGYQNGRRKRPSRLNILTSALKYIKILKEKQSADTESNNRDGAFSYAGIHSKYPIVVGYRCTTSSTSNTDSSESGSDTLSDTVDSGIASMYGAVLTSPIEQDAGNHLLSPWLPTNCYIESEHCIGGNSSSGCLYCTCDEQYGWHYEYPPPYAT